MSSNHNGQRPHCSTCNKTFGNNKTLQAHRNSKGHVRRSGVGQTQLHHCRVCGKTFTRRNSMRRHARDVHWIVDNHDRLTVDDPPTSGPNQSDPTTQMILEAIGPEGPVYSNKEQELLARIGSRFNHRDSSNRHPYQDRVDTPQLIPLEPPAVRDDPYHGFQVAATQELTTNLDLHPSPLINVRPPDAAVDLFRASIWRRTREVGRYHSPPRVHPSYPGPERGPIRLENVQQSATLLDQDHLHRSQRSKRRPHHGTWKDEARLERADEYH